MPERLTAAQVRWLTRLRDGGVVANRGRGPCGITCMRRGWTEWAYRRGDEVVGRAEMEARYRRPSDDCSGLSWRWSYEDGWRNCGEMLTAAGRRALEDTTDDR